MLEQVLMYLNNWFIVQDGVYEGTYQIENGSIVLPFLRDGQYFRILGSVFNDGVHKYPKRSLVNEEFQGAIWALAVPQSIVDLASEMSQWQEKYGAAVSAPYQSESFGGYSSSKASGKSGGLLTVWDVFESWLKAYKKPQEVSYVKPFKPQTPPYYVPFRR